MKLFALLLIPAVVLAGDFCYKDASCGPDSTAWDGQCHSGKTQSPINIELTPETPVGDKRGIVPDSNYKATRTFTIQNNGHTVKATLASANDQPGFISGDLVRGRRYIFAELHFHWGSEDNKGSEHTINGKSYAMEGHFVHYNSDYASFADAVASSDPSALAVIGVMFEVRDRDNAALEPFTSKLHQVKVSGNTCTANLNLYDIFPSQYTKIAGGDTVVQYSGSLTTPKCKEIVLWTVLPAANYVSHAQINHFRSLEAGHGEPMVNNFRPVLPINGRTLEPATATFG